MKTILVIDDNEDLLGMICNLLSRSGYNVLSAIDGEQGLKVYFDNSPDLVVTDLVMPNKEGIELIVELNAQQPKPKIIAISGGGKIGPEVYLPLAETLGADDILQKPFRKDEFLYAVKNLLSY